MLQTARLLLRPLDAGDEQSFIALYSDPLVCQFAPHFPLTEQQAKENLHRILAQRTASGFPTFFVIVEPLSRNFVGTCNFRWNATTQEQEVVYHLCPDFWGRGYATEAVQALLAYGFTALGLPRIAGRCVAENRASRRVMEKCGMRPDGEETLLAKDGNFHQEAFRDVTYHRFVLDAPERAH
jgi:ribosomal-protein-alanine N-acetyltransferase